MSANMFWEPARRKANYLPDGIRRAVALKWFGHDGSLGSDRITINSRSISFLEGIIAGGNDEARSGAQALIEAIDKYDEIEIWIDH